ncbi:DUF2147 domain-containing protein [Phenylobacterium sp.]|uniref:DUF2147 domain-containing protein n=1 Tax=Phenylobacterium sp. TaxID=1871053 RepID=UPI002F4282D7
MRARAFPVWLVAALAAGALGEAQAAARIEGDWLAAGGDAKVRIGPCPAAPDRLCGAVVWLREPLDDDGTPRRDEKNPAPALRSRPVIGLNLIRDFRPSGPGRWTGGRIYDPRDGRTYDARLALKPDGTLKVDGCVLMFCRAQTWRRAP